MTQNKFTNRSPFKTGVLIAAASLLTTGFTLSGHFNLKPFTGESYAHRESSKLIKPQTFEQIEIGMNLTEVRSAVGNPGAEVSSSIKTSQYRWGDWEDAHILCAFENGVLVSKTRYNF